MIFFTLNLVFAAIAIYFLFLGLKVFLRKKPFVISAKYNFFVILVTFAVQLVIPISNLFRASSFKEDNFDWFFLASPLFLVVLYAVLLIYLWKTTQGYQIIGVTEDTFRTSLQNVLRKLGLPFEERLSKMRLTSLEVDLESLINSWSGVATIKIKDAKHKKFEKEIAENLRKELDDDYISVNLRTSYFYLITGRLFFIFSIGFSYWTWTTESFWRNY
jgi:hypothetical protein